MRPFEWTYPKEERKLPTIKANPEELRLQALLLYNVVIVAGLHFLLTRKVWLLSKATSSRLN